MAYNARNELRHLMVIAVYAVIFGAEDEKKLKYTSKHKYPR